MLIRIIDILNRMKEFFKNNIQYFLKREDFNLTIFLFSYIFFFFSLEKCFSGSDICGNKKSWIKRKLIQVIISEKLIYFLFIRIISKKISKFHLIHFILIFLFFYFYSHHYIFEDHGMYNLIVFFLLLLMNFISYFLCKILILFFHHSFYIKYFINFFQIKK